MSKNVSWRLLSDFTLFNPNFCCTIFNGWFVRGVQSTLTALYHFRQGESWRYALLQNSSSDQKHMNQLPFKMTNRCVWAGSQPNSDKKRQPETKDNAFNVSLQLSFFPCLSLSQGDHTWATMLGQSVRLQPVAIQSLSELERARLQEVALYHLERRDLDFKISIPRGTFPLQWYACWNPFCDDLESVVRRFKCTVNCSHSQDMIVSDRCPRNLCKYVTVSSQVFWGDFQK